jgi:O-antigen/teichoic acid export membrane protein
MDRPDLSCEGKQTVRNLVVLLFCQSLFVACQLFNLILWTKALGSEAYGRYVFAAALFPYFFSIGSLGGGVVAIREIRRNSSCFEDIASSFLAIAATASGLSTLFAVGILSILPLSDDDRLLFATVAIGSLFPCIGPLPFFDAFHRQGLGAVAITVVEYANLAIILTINRWNALSLPILAWSLFGRWILTTMLQWGLFLCFVHRMSFQLRVATWRRILTASVSPILAALIWSAANNLSVVLVRFRFGNAETAVYGIALMIATAAATMNDLVLRVYAPHILGDNGLRRDFVVRLVLSVTALSLGIAVIAFIGAATLIQIGLEPVYHDLLAPLALMLIANIIRIYWAINDFYLLRFDKQRISLLAMCCVTIGANSVGLLTPKRLSILGFPIGMCLSYAGAALFTFFAMRHYRHRMESV